MSQHLDKPLSLADAWREQLKMANIPQAPHDAMYSSLTRTGIAVRFSASIPKNEIWMVAPDKVTIMRFVDDTNEQSRRNRQRIW